MSSIISIAHSSIFKVMVMKLFFALYYKLYYMIKILIIYIIFEPRLGKCFKKVLNFYTLQIYSRYLYTLYTLHNLNLLKLF